MTHWKAPAPVNPVAVGPVLIDVPEWMDRARCAGLSDDTFYPAGPSGRPRDEHGPVNEGVERAKSFCRACPVTAECLAHGIRERDGIWGGTTPEERARIRWRADRQRARDKARRFPSEVHRNA